MRSVMIVSLYLLVTPALAPATPIERIDLYGGPGTLEGQFETADGDPDPQGWTTQDDTRIVSTDKWSITSRDVANLDPGTPGNHAWWCGQDFPACSPSDSAWGYGNDWHTALSWSRAVGPALEATVRLTGTLNADLEPGYDWLYVEAVTNDGAYTLVMLDGFHRGYALDETVVLAADELPDGEVRLRLRVKTDSSYSDEDCLQETTGALQADNLQVTISQAGQPDWASPVETCEPGSVSQWSPLDQDYYVGDFAALWTGLGELDPDMDNPTPQWAFINDGLVQPGVPASPCIANCYGDGAHSVYYGDEALANSIISPPIALPADWNGTVRLSFDTYQHVANAYMVFIRWGLLVTDDPAGVGGWTMNWYDLAYGRTNVTRFFRPVLDLTEEMVPPTTRFVRIRLQARFVFEGWGRLDSPAPYIDNVHLQLLPPGVADSPPPVDAFTAEATPNPFNPAVTISWYLLRDRDLAVSVYDVHGRFVRTLRTGPAAAGPGHVVWQGRDEQGRAAGAGVYFCRLESAAELRTLKVTLLK